MLLRHHSTSRPSMKTSKLVCILGLALVTGLSLVCVHGKRQYPSHHEIKPLPNHPDDEHDDDGSPGFPKIAQLMIILLTVFLLLLLLVYYGWEKIRSLLIKWCCSQPVLPIEWNNVHFHAIDLCVDGVEDDSEATNCNFSGSPLTEGGDVLTHLSSLQVLVATELPMTDDLPSERVDRVTSFSPIERFSVGADDIMIQESDNEIPAPPKLLEIDDLPVENHDKDCHINPASRGAVPGDSMQSAGSMGKDLVENFFVTGLQKPAVTDQCTSTTELHLSSAKEVSDIPEDFLDYCLRKRMLDIPIEFHRKICMMLDIPRDLHWDDNYRILAQKIGLTTDDISWLGQQNNKTELILQKFDTQKDPSIRRFKAILDEMERNDVVAVIEEWIQYERSKENNNSSSHNF